MRNFDEERGDIRPLDERQFQLRGKKLTVRERVHPRAMALMEDTLIEASSEVVLEKFNEAMKMFLVPSDAKAWDKLAANTDDPVTKEDLSRISEFVAEVTTERPTTAPSASTDGRDHTGATSERPSSQREAIPAT